MEYRILGKTGLKVSRVILMFKNMGRELKHLVRPNSVNVVRMDGEAVPTETLQSRLCGAGLQGGWL